MGKLIRLLLLMFFVGVFCTMAAVADDSPAPFVYKDEGKRDPLWPLVGSTGNVITYDSDFMIADLVLEGVMSDGGNSGIAMINGKILGINDKIGQFVIVQINTNEVVLQKGDQRFTLRLKKEE